MWCWYFSNKGSLKSLPVPKTQGILVVVAVAPWTVYSIFHILATAVIRFIATIPRRAESYLPQHLRHHPEPLNHRSAVGGNGQIRDPFSVQ